MAIYTSLLLKVYAVHECSQPQLWCHQVLDVSLTTFLSLQLFTCWSWNCVWYRRENMFSRAGYIYIGLMFSMWVLGISNGKMVFCGGHLCRIWRCCWPGGCWCLHQISVHMLALHFYKMRILIQIGAWLVYCAYLGFDVCGLCLIKYCTIDFNSKNALNELDFSCDYYKLGISTLRTFEFYNIYFLY